MMKRSVSILIPAYNAQEWVAEAIGSALAQTWQEKELIIVDDGSTDATLNIARQFESDNVRVVTQTNQGAASARNRAFSLSRGDYIQWLDADDLLASDKISRQMQRLEECRSERILLSSEWGAFMYRHHRAAFGPTALWSDLSPTEWLMRKMGQNLHMQTATWLVSRELSKSAGLWDTTLLGDDDGEYFCRVLLASDGVRFVPGAKVYYRATPNSLSYVGRTTRKLEAQWRSMQLHIRYLRFLADNDRVRAACVTYLQTWLPYFHPERMDIVSQAEHMAEELGGKLDPPRFPWKYSWIDAMFGATAARRAQVILPRIRAALVRSWDKSLYRIESRAFAGNLRERSAYHRRLG